VLDKLYVDRSDFIEQGEIAASLEAGVERASVVLAKARAAIDSEVQVNSVNLDFDQRRKDRYDALYQKKTISIDLKEEAEREQRLSLWRLQQAKDLKDIRQLELLRAEEQLQQKTIRTPFSGFVLQRFKGAGEYVEDQPIMRIAQLDPLAVEAIVPIGFHGQLKAGMRAQVFTEGGSGQSYEAEVTTIDRAGDAASGTFGIRLTLPNPEYRVLAGVKCLMKFSVGAVR
jgi:multidrug efflux pump subunit AcrA (membrane-fusion protein)